MKTLKEINTGCGNSFGFMEEYVCGYKHHGLCPICQALKEQMEDIIKELIFNNIACCEDCTASCEIKRILIG